MENNQANGQSQVAYGRLFRNRHYLALWLGQTVSFIGDYFNWIAIPIIVERLTGSTLMVGLTVMSNALPALVLGPVAGVFVDRWDRKRTMVVSDLLRALLVLLCLTVRTADQVWVFYVVGFLMSCVSRFFFPAQSAVLPLIVPDKDDLLAANGLMQIVQTAGLLIGPALAGFAIAAWGEQAAFLVDSLTFFVSAAAILTMTVPKSVDEQSERASNVAAVWAELREGTSFLIGSSVMVGVLICMTVVMLGVGVINVLWVPFLQRIFEVGPKGIGMVDSAQGLGMVVGGVLLGFFTARFSKRSLISWSVMLIGVSIGGMGFSPAFGYLLAFSVVLGVALVPAQSALMTIMQLAVPDLKRGRVSGAMNALTTFASLVSMAAAAALSEWTGLRPMYVIAGLIVIAAGVLGFVVIKEPEVPVTELA